MQYCFLKYTGDFNLTSLKEKVQSAFSMVAI